MVMQIGQVVGHAVATVKHASMQGWRLLLVQPLGTGRQPDGEPILAIDHLGAGPGARVIVTSEGAAVRELMGAKDSPVRWMVLGLCDP
jgi:ethanolamine utilization protein EutN